jgi:hypothetical protein
MAGEGITDPSRVGLRGAGAGLVAGTDNNELFLKKFSGEILQSFEESNIFKPLHTIRTIENGKSAQFPVTGIASANYHTPGENIAEEGGATSKYLSDIKKTERVITIDDMLVASTFLANIDDMKNHYDIRSVYANELGKALAKRFDEALAKVFIAAARSDANLSGRPAGGILDVSANVMGTGADSGDDTDNTDPTGAELVAALFTAAQKLDENDVPSDGRFCVLRPKEYYKLVTGADASNSFNLVSAVNKDIGGVGSIASGTIPQIAGISIYKSNHIPDADLSAVSTGDGLASNDVFGAGGYGYNGNFLNTLGIVSHSAAVGTVKLLDLATESEYQIERQGTLFVAKYAMGHGILRPECAIELQK